MPRTVRIGTRGSALARTQSEWVAAGLRRHHPGLRVELREISTEGDRTQHTNVPAPAWGRGVFVKEIEAALLRDEIDLAVHSLKDVPPDVPAGLTIAAVPTREDPRDALVSGGRLAFEELPAGARVGTSSARRVAFLRAVRTDLEYVSIRGNVDTRYRKLLADEYDAIVLAQAGLARLGLDVPRVLLGTEMLLPAPGQGALGLEIRGGDAELHRLLAPLNDPAAALAVRAERALMRQLDASCRLPVAALAEVHGDTVSLSAAVASADGARVLRTRLEGPSSDPEKLGLAAAERLRSQGALELLVDAEHVLSA
jgi:hydroxymethylbilane synthase